MGGNVTWAGGITYLCGSYTNGVMGYGQRGVADIMDRVAVLLYRTVHFLWPV